MNEKEVVKEERKIIVEIGSTEKKKNTRQNESYSSQYCDRLRRDRERKKRKRTEESAEEKIERLRKRNAKKQKTTKQKDVDEISM